MSVYIGHFDGREINDQRVGMPVYAADWLDETAVVNEGVMYVAKVAEPHRTELLRRAEVLPGS